MILLVAEQSANQPEFEYEMYSYDENEEGSPHERQSGSRFGQLWQSGVGCKTGVA